MLNRPYTQSPPREVITKLSSAIITVTITDPASSAQMNHVSEVGVAWKYDLTISRTAVPRLSLGCWSFSETSDGMKVCVLLAPQAPFLMQFPHILQKWRREPSQVFGHGNCLLGCLYLILQGILCDLTVDRFGGNKDW